jgi:hypothetical protein
LCRDNLLPVVLPLVEERIASSDVVGKGRVEIKEL